MPQLPTGVTVAAGVDETSALVMVIAAAVAAVIVLAVSPRVAIPVVVLELLLGILIGPQGLDIAQIDPTTSLLGDLGLGMLFFFAGYEIDAERIGGAPARLASAGWLMSIALAYAIGAALEASGLVVSFLYAGSALASTALGLLLPILRDAGELRTPFGTQVLAVGTVGEVGPILLITLVLSTTHPVHEAVVLIAFVLLAVLTGVLAVRSAESGGPLVQRGLETSGQLGVRVIVVLVFGLVALAAELGLDILLGGLMAGLITRAALRGHEIAVLESKLAAVGYGFLIPFFFVVSGMRFDLDALTSDPSTALRVPLFLALFLVVRGVPALVLYRHVLGGRDRLALACLSATTLPIVVAITTLAVRDGHMRSANAAALVGAAILSALVLPLAGLALRRGRAEAIEVADAPAGGG
ncbi:MAG: cation:proton antiporter [Candidatus Limnocylindrales bacterium]